MVLPNVWQIELIHYLKGAVNDVVVDKYTSSGLGREAVSFAVLNYGDNPVKVDSTHIPYLV